jgi:hypothetical protein
LKCVSWNLLKGGIDAGDDARMRRQMSRIAAEQPAVVMLQELNGWDADGETLAHRAEELLGGMRGCGSCGRATSSAAPTGTEYRA